MTQSRTEQIDLSRVVGWLSHCDAHHSVACRDRSIDKFTSQKSTNIFLIDTHEEHIVEKPLNERFIALSYVWGGVDQLRLLDSNIARLRKAGFLLESKDPVAIPRIIRDAMFVSRAIGERYLWVDTMCIIQDNASHKEAQIAQMAAIYSAALVTLVACIAIDANSPLPGVKPNTRLSTLVDISGMDKSELPWVEEPIRFLGGVLARTPHNQRAWTFQEVILSKRCLFFLGSTVVFQCQHSRRVETESEEEDRGPMNQAGNWPPLSESFPGRLFRYGAMVHDYTRRHLTFSSDRLDAFTGLLSALEVEWQWSFVFGLPLHAFGWSLLWVPNKRYRIQQGTIPQDAYEAFPSWSWLSHGGPCYYHLEIAADHPSPGIMIDHVDWPKTVMWDGKRALELKDVVSSKKFDETTIEETDPMANLYRDYPTGTMTIMGYMATLPTLGPDKPSEALDKFEIQRKEYLDAGQEYLALINCEGHWYGTLMGITRDRLLSLMENQHEELSLVLLSTAHSTWVMGGFRKPILCFDSVIYQNEAWCTRNVLLITSGSRPYRRIAVGEVHRDEWERLDPRGDLVWLAWKYCYVERKAR